MAVMGDIGAPVLAVANLPLWEAFYEGGRQLEMLVSKSGRQLFPFPEIKLDKLCPDSLYAVTMWLMPVDRQWYKFSKMSGWSQGHCIRTPDMPGYLLKWEHPDSKNSTGSIWMQQKTSFRRAKIYNSDSVEVGLVEGIPIQPRRKYFLQFTVTKLTDDARQMLREQVTYTFKFPQLTFISVTQYRDEHIKNLKIKYNPYAVAFQKGKEKEEDASVDVPSADEGRDTYLFGVCSEQRTNERAWPGHQIRTSDPLASPIFQTSAVYSQPARRPSSIFKQNREGKEYPMYFSAYKEAAVHQTPAIGQDMLTTGSMSISPCSMPDTSPNSSDVMFNSSGANLPGLLDHLSYEEFASLMNCLEKECSFMLPCGQFGDQCSFLARSPGLLTSRSASAVNPGVSTSTIDTSQATMQRFCHGNMLPTLQCDCTRDLAYSFLPPNSLRWPHHDYMTADTTTQDPSAALSRLQCY